MYHLRILTPQETFFDDQIISLIAPGVLGYLGILKDHAPLISTLKPGILIVTTKDHTKEFYKVEGGFLEVKNNEVSVLADTIEISPPIHLTAGL